MDIYLVRKKMQIYNVQCNWSLASLAEYFGKYRYIQLGDSLIYI